MTGLKGENIIRDQSSHDLSSALAAEPDAHAITAIDNQCSRAQRSILVSVMHTSQLMEVSGLLGGGSQFHSLAYEASSKSTG
jgi:hypothetical protein